MRKRIQNQLSITCKGVDLTAVTKIEFYVRQAGLFRTYMPDVVDANHMTVVIPFEDAMRLSQGKAKLQFAFVDANGNPQATDIIEVSVHDFLKEAGYDPV